MWEKYDEFHKYQSRPEVRLAYLEYVEKERKKQRKVIRKANKKINKEMREYLNDPTYDIKKETR